MRARTHTRSSKQRRTERIERERQIQSVEESCRDRRAYTAIERGDSYGGGRAIELKTEVVSCEGKRHGVVLLIFWSSTSHRCRR